MKCSNVDVCGCWDWDYGRGRGAGRRQVIMQIGVN